MLFTLQAWLAAIALVGLAISFRASKYFERRVSGLNVTHKEQLADVAVALAENVSAQAVVKGFSLQQRELAAFRGRLMSLRDVAVRANWMNYVMQRIPNVGVLVMNLVTLALGAYFVFHDRMTVGELVAFFAVFGNMAVAVNNVSYAIPSLLEGAAGMERVLEILHARPTVPEGADATPLPRLARAIELAGVTFGYTPDTTSVANVSLSIAAGTAVAFVGTSGSGKTTLLNLIDRLYDPRSGAVRYDGRDIREVTTTALRAQIGIVFQDSVLFDTTIRDNIRMGRPDATDADVEAAAAQAEVHAAIGALPDGYDTIVGERGIFLPLVEAVSDSGSRSRAPSSAIRRS